MNEADTCRKFIVPRLQAAGWDNEPHSIAEQRTITDGRIVLVGQGFVRRPPKRVDYLLRYTRDFPLAVVEAKPTYKIAGDGLQQTKQYAEMLGLSFAYASNGQEIIEFDFVAGLEKTRPDFPTPDELWNRYRAGRGLAQDAVAQRLLTPSNYAVGKGERYYQQIAIIGSLGRPVSIGQRVAQRVPGCPEPLLDTARAPPERPRPTWRSSRSTASTWTRPRSSLTWAPRGPHWLDQSGSRERFQSPRGPPVDLLARTTATNFDRAVRICSAQRSPTGYSSRCLLPPC